MLINTGEDYYLFILILWLLVEKMKTAFNKNNECMISIYYEVYYEVYKWMENKFKCTQSI